MVYFSNFTNLVLNSLKFKAHKADSYQLSFLWCIFWIFTVYKFPYYGPPGMNGIVLSSSVHPGNLNISFDLGETVFQSISGHVPEREREERETIDERKMSDCPNNPNLHLLQAQ